MASVKEFDGLPSRPSGDTKGVEAELMEVLRQERNKKQRKNLLVKRRKHRDKEKSKQKRPASIEDIGIGMMQDTPTGTTAGETYAESVRLTPREIRTDTEVSPSRQSRILKESASNYDSAGSGFAQWETDWNFGDNNASQAPMGEAAQSDDVSDFSNPDFNPLSFHGQQDSTAENDNDDDASEGRKPHEKSKRSGKDKDRSKKSKRKTKKREEGHRHRRSRKEKKGSSNKSDEKAQQSKKERRKEKKDYENELLVTGEQAGEENVALTTSENKWENKYRQLEADYASLSLHVNIITRQAEQAVECLREEQKNVRELESEHYKMQNDLRDARRERDRYEREMQKLKKEVSKLSKSQNGAKKDLQTNSKLGTRITQGRLYTDRDAILDQAIQAHRSAGFPSYEQNGVAVGQVWSRSRPITREDLEGRERSYAVSSYEGSDLGGPSFRSRSARPLTQKKLDVESRSSYQGSNHGSMQSSNFGGSNYHADGEDFASAETESKSSWWGGDAFRKKNSGGGPKQSWTRSLMFELAEERVVLDATQLAIKEKNQKDDNTGGSSKSMGTSEHSKNSDWSSMYQVAARPNNEA